MITRPNEYWDLLYRLQDKNNPAATAGQIPPIQLPADEPTLKIDLNTRKIEAPEFLSVMYDHRAEILFFEVDRYYDGIDLANTCCIVLYINANPKKLEGHIYAVPYYDTVSRQYLPIKVNADDYYKNPSYYYVSVDPIEKYIPCTEYSVYNELIDYYQLVGTKYNKVEITKEDFDKNPTEYFTKMYPINFRQCASDELYSDLTEYYYQANKMLIPWLISGDVTEYAGKVEYAVRFYTLNPDGYNVLSFSLNTMTATSKVLYGVDVTSSEPYDYEADFIERVLYRLSMLEGDYNLHWLEVHK